MYYFILFWINIISKLQCVKFSANTQIFFTWNVKSFFFQILTHWGRVTHICVGKLTIIGWDNGLSPSRRQAIIWTNAGILLIQTVGTNFSEILSKTQMFSFKKMHLNMLSVKWRQLGLHELNHSCGCLVSIINDSEQNKHGLRQVRHDVWPIMM